MDISVDKVREKDTLEVGQNERQKTRTFMLIAIIYRGEGT